MSPPSYEDLGESAHELLTKGYNYGLWKVDWKSRSDNLKFVTSCVSNHEAESFWGNFELRHKWKEHGIKFASHLSTDGEVKTSLFIKDQLIDGLKLNFVTSIVPNIGKKSAGINAAYKTKQSHSNVSLDFDLTGPNLSTSSVFKRGHWLLGVLLRMEPRTKRSISYQNLAIGYRSDDFDFTFSVSDGAEYEGSLYQKIDKNLKLAVVANWSSVSNEARIMGGVKYSTDSGIYRAKLTSFQQVALSYQLELWKGVTLTLSTLLEGDRSSANSHKFGAGLQVKL